MNEGEFAVTEREYVNSRLTNNYFGKVQQEIHSETEMDESGFRNRAHESIGEKKSEGIGELYKNDRIIELCVNPLLSRKE